MFPEKFCVTAFSFTLTNRCPETEERRRVNISEFAARLLKPLLMLAMLLPMIPRSADAGDSRIQRQQAIHFS